MSTKLKDRFLTPDSLAEFANLLAGHGPDFEVDRFLGLVLDEQWETLELMGRVRRAAQCLQSCLPEDYKTALSILDKVAAKTQGMESLILPQFVEQYGLEDWDLSLPALARYTRYSSSEFAVRPYLLADAPRVMACMVQWADDKNEHVRRFASEGCRPRLPWGVALPAFKADPSPIWPVLEKLKDDGSEYVRKSVANNLNDIAKDNPDQVLDVCERWFGQSERTDWIVKRGCRTLLKQGNKRALVLFGYEHPDNIEISGLVLSPPSATIGQKMAYAFVLTVKGKQTCKLRVEYGLDFMKANGRTSRKIFQIVDREYEPGQYEISRHHNFEDRTTRRHYVGQHGLAILVNGQEMAIQDFSLDR